jgi:hypothetical protein
LIEWLDNEQTDAEVRKQQTAAAENFRKGKLGSVGMFFRSSRDFNLLLIAQSVSTKFTATTLIVSIAVEMI